MNETCLLGFLPIRREKLPLPFPLQSLYRARGTISESVNLTRIFKGKLVYHSCSSGSCIAKFEDSAQILCHTDTSSNARSRKSRKNLRKFQLRHVETASAISIGYSKLQSAVEIESLIQKLSTQDSLVSSPALKTIILKFLS